MVSRQELALVAITVVWGASFLIVQRAVEHSGPWFFVGVRFLSAAFAGAVVFRRSLRAVTRRELVAGASVGLMIWAGYGLQTVGLQTITASASAFITALYVPLVPLLLWLVFRTRPRAMTLVGLCAAFAGLVLLADPAGLDVGPGRGEALTLIATLAIAGEIILIDRFAGTVRIGAVTVVQLAVAGLLAVATMPFVGEPLPAFSWVWLVAGVGLGVASCVIQITMNWAQRTVSPTRATLIYAGEPVWGGIVGAMGGDRRPLICIIGAVLIVAGVVVSELRIPRLVPATSPDSP